MEEFSFLEGNAFLVCGRRAHLVAVGGDAGEHQVGEAQAAVGVVARLPRLHQLLEHLPRFRVLLCLQVQLACGVQPFPMSVGKTADMADISPE